MEQLPKENFGETEEAYFKSYEMGEDDKEVLLESAKTLFSLGVLGKETLDDLRIASFDSKNFYVITKGEHQSTDEFKVEDASQNEKDFHIYCIGHGKNFRKRDYAGAGAWYEVPELEETALNAKKVPNPKVLENKEKILKAILIPPKEVFERIHGSRFEYDTDLVFHEAGHIEEMLLRDWPNEGEIPAFPSEKQRREFMKTLDITQDIDRATIGEMYAMMIDREAKRQLGFEHIDMDDEAQKMIDSSHKKGYLLAKALEEKYPDFIERKKWIQSLMK
ncbi:MAG: hypothetical protein Q8O83_01950 [bacterium]|nr:hypothetical protein [bacterium]